MPPVELAMASASHRGHPVQIAIVEAMLSGVDLGESDLRCPRDWPISREAALRLSGYGEREMRRIWHNCSGKHAGFLRACVAQGWRTETYLDPDNPIQRRVVAVVSELGEFEVSPVGVDGCGAPVLRTSVRAMALLYARLASEPSLREVFVVMHRYPALIASNGEGDSVIATAVNAAAKGGAEGCIGVGLDRRLGIAVKSWDGLLDIANVGAVAALEALGELPGPAPGYLEPIARPDVRGGGRVVGETEPRLELRFS